MSRLRWLGSSTRSRIGEVAVTVARRGVAVAGPPVHRCQLAEEASLREVSDPLIVTLDVCGPAQDDEEVAACVPAAGHPLASVDATKARPAGDAGELLRREIREEVDTRDLRGRDRGRAAAGAG
jgi:hypothetical protein